LPQRLTSPAQEGQLESALKRSGFARTSFESALPDRVSEQVEAETAGGLFAADEPAPVLAERLESASPFVFVSDHAGRRLPRALGDLGLAASEFERHIAYDIGILPVARQLAAAFEAPLVAQTYSRLAIDCNRPTHVAQSIPESSELTEIPGNHMLAPEQREARIEALFRPYHDRIEALLDARSARGLPSILIAMHSFTPVYMGVPRPWTVGLLYNRDARLASPLLDLMNADGAPYVGDKLPYAVDDLSDYTLPVHGERRGLLHVGIEIRQDLIGEPRGQADWVFWLESMLRRVGAVCGMEVEE
jgi:predicted N-formylglutamate amidohydrolase